MPGTRHVRLSLETFLKRSWPVLIVGAALLLTVSGILFWYAVSGKGRTSLPATSTSTPSLLNSTSTQDLIPRELDGVLVPVSESRLQPYAVMVENHTDARPLSGPAKANLVYEIPVEGGITRYLLVFDATTTVESIGPVRSARPYFVDMADSLNAVYAHVGGSPASLSQISGMSGFRDVNEFWNGKFFWRSQKRVAPHSTYTRTDLLHQVAQDKKWSEGHVKGWRYKEDDPLESTSTKRGEVNGPRVSYGGSYTTRWSYRKTDNVYQRIEAGVEQQDADGSRVQAKNVIVVLTESKVLDEVGRLSVRTTGKGKAVLYRDGKKFDLTWRRVAGEHIRFETLDGSEALFNRGTSWIEVVVYPFVFASIDAGSS